jgi:hypothetical protein
MINCFQNLNFDFNLRRYSKDMIKYAVERSNVVVGRVDHLPQHPLRCAPRVLIQMSSHDLTRSPFLRLPLRRLHHVVHPHVFSSLAMSHDGSSSPFRTGPRVASITI